MTGIGMGGLLFAPLFRQLISSHGWRWTFIFAGVIFILMAGFAGALKRPYEFPTPKQAAILEGDNTKEQVCFRARDMVVTPRFLILLALTFVAFMAFQVTSIHLVPYSSDVGLSPTVTAVALGLIGGASVPGRFLSGVLADRIGWGRTLAGALLGCAAAISGLIFVRQDWMLICVVGLLGVCHGMRAVAVMGLLGRFFGTVALGELIGIMIAAGQILSAPGPYIAGYWYDVGGSYSLMFALLAIALSAGAIMVLKTGLVTSGAISREART
jgi:MFS family permease